MFVSPPPPPPILRQKQKQAPLSYSQESLWFLHQLDPGNIAYNSTFIYKLTGEIDPSYMEQAINALVRRHEILRTLYPSAEGIPFQVVQPFEPLSLPNVDYSHLPVDERQKAIHQYASEHSNQPYDLKQGPLVRFALLHNSIDENYLFFGIHHISFDGWSRQVFFKELMQLYDAYASGQDPALPDLPIQYTDYAIWQRAWLSGDTLDTYLAHWKDILSGDLPVLDLHTDRPRPSIQTYRGGTHHFILRQPLSTQVRSFCQRERITPFHLLLAAYAILLSRHTGQEDIIIGCPFANRVRPELDGLVGMFVNTLPIRIDLSGNPSVRAFLDRVRTLMVDAFTWQAAPFESLVSEIAPERDLSRTPVFQTVINLTFSLEQHGNTFKVTKEANDNEVSKFDFDLHFINDNQLFTASIKYNADIYNENTIRYLASHYQNLLSGLLSKTDSCISELDMLTSSEHKRILHDWNITTDYPRDKTIQQLFEEQSALTPNAPALIFKNQVLTYNELNQQANQLAFVLRDLDVRPEVCVGVYIERSFEMVVALLAILKAGGVYVPLDQNFPKERMAFVLTDTKAPIVLTLKKHIEDLPTYLGEVLCVDDETLYKGKSTENLTVQVAAENLAYIMYTSGSTGMPKGCCIPHRGVVRLVKDTNYFDFNPNEVFLQFAPLAFDASTFEIWGPLLNGSKLVIFPPHLPNLAELTDFVEKNGVTTMWLTSGLFHQVIEFHPEIVDHLNQLISGGDVLSPPHVNIGLIQNPKCKFYNGYGPTENTTFTCTYRIKELVDEKRSIPIGRPIANTRVYILDKYRQPVPIGVVGEIYTGGQGLAREYLNQPELTAEKFIPDPFHPQEGTQLYRTGDYGRWLPDGNIEFLGRKDNQVKVRGFRIELGEIENTLKRHKEVQEAVLLVNDEGSGEKELTAYIVLSSKKSISPTVLGTFLEARLPRFMIPTKFLFIDTIPLTVNGKIDRQALPKPELTILKEQYVPPRNGIEEKLVTIWQEVMRVEKVGVRDNFFELGGHSLMAVRLFTRIRDEFGKTLPLMMLYQNGTVEAIAIVIQSEDKLNFPQGISPIRSEGTKAPLFILSAGFRFNELALALSPDRPVFILDPIEDGKKTYKKTVRETAKIYYKNLVNFFPKGPYLLIGHSNMGYFALETARLLIEKGKEVTFLGLLDTYPPGLRKKKFNILDRIKFHTNNLKDKRFKGVCQYFLKSMARFIRRWRRKIPVNMGTIARYEQEGRLKEILRLIERQYKLESYSGKVYLFWVKKGSKDPINHWKRFIKGQFNTIPIGGNHFTMFLHPYVVDLAKKIEKCIN